MTTSKVFLLGLLAIVVFFSVMSQWRLAMLTHLLMGAGIGFVMGAIWARHRHYKSQHKRADDTTDRL